MSNAPTVDRGRARRSTPRATLARLAVAALLAITASVAVPHSVAASPTDVASVVSQTNAARTYNGLPALVRNHGLDDVANRWAQAMGAASAMSHNPSFSTQIPAGWTHAGENVATGYDSIAVVTAWMNSPGHRANILGDYTDVGVGYFVDAGGVAWCVQNFATYPGAAMSNPAPPQSAPAPAPVPTTAPAPTTRPAPMARAVPVPAVPAAPAPVATVPAPGPTVSLDPEAAPSQPRAPLTQAEARAWMVKPPWTVRDGLLYQLVFRERS